MMTMITSSVNVLLGQAPALNLAEFEYIPPLSDSGEPMSVSCRYMHQVKQIL